MFYCTTDGQYINEGSGFTIDGVQYPSNWLNLSTLEEKTALGLVEVIATNLPANPEYYWVSENLKGAKLIYVNTPKDLVSVQEMAISKVKQMTFSILQPSDYIDARNLRDPSYKPNWIVWRASIRATAADTITAIGKAINVDEVADIMTKIVWASDPNTPIVA